MFFTEAQLRGGGITVLPPDKSKRQAKGKDSKDRVNRDGRENRDAMEGNGQEQKETKENSDGRR
jgi:hypothetical protein